MKKNIIFLVVVLSTIISGYAQWEECGLNNTSTRCICVKDSLIFAGTALYGLQISSNHGENWYEANTGLNSVAGIFALALHDSIVFAIQQQQEVFKSSNNGASWVSASNGLPQTQTTLTAIAVCGNSIFVGTYNSGIFKSTDNGDSWVAVNNGLTNPYVTTLAVSGSTIYAGTAWWEGGVFVSTDYGDSWSLISHGLPEEDVKSMTIKDNNIFVAYRTFGIYFSSDNGTNWAQRNNGLTDIRIFSIKYLRNIFFASSISNAVYISYNNGQNLINFNDNLINPFVVDFAMDNTYLYMSGGAGIGLWRRKLIELTELTESDDIKGVNVYPNPANNKLNIDLSFPSETKIKITLCDVMGNNIKTIDEGYYNNKHIESNVVDLSNGIYLLKIELPNKTIIKKIAVVK